MQFNASQREINLKVVYYGPPLSGKTTNLQSLHKLLGGNTGHLTVLNTADDRTLFFDLLPVLVQLEGGYRIKIKLFTVPGQVIHAATRRIVLSGADGVVFVADSQLSESKVNNEYWHGMRRYMRESGLDPENIPAVIQFNKRDMPDVRSDTELEEVRKKGKEPLFKAVALSGDGVLETLRGLLELMFNDLNQRYDFEKKFHMSTSSILSSIFDKRPPPAPSAAA